MRLLGDTNALAGRVGLRDGVARWGGAAGGAYSVILRVRVLRVGGPDATSGRVAAVVAGCAGGVGDGRDSVVGEEVLSGFGGLEGRDGVGELAAQFADGSGVRV